MIEVGSIGASISLDSSGLKKGLDSAAQAMAAMADRLHANSGALDDLTRAMESASASGNRLTGAQTAAATAMKEVGNAAQGATTKLKTASDALGSFGAAATRAGRQLSLALTTPLLSLAGNAVRIEAGYEDSMNRLQGATGASAAQMAVLGQKATDLGKDLTLPGTSAVTAGQAMLSLAQAGLNVRDIFDAALPTMRLSAATHIENAKAAEVLAVTLNEFSLSGREATHVADLLTAAGNRTVGGVTALYEGLRKAGPVMHDLRIPVNDTVVALTLLNQHGIHGAEAGTALANVFARLVDPSKKANAILKEQGINLFDASGKMKDLSEVAQILHDKLGKLTDAQRLQVEHQLGQARGMKVLSVLAAEGSKGFDEMAKKVNLSGEAARQAQKQMEGLPGAIKAMQTAFTAASKAAIEPIAKDLADLGKRAGELLTRFTDLPAPTRKLWVEIGLGAAALGPALLLIGQMASGLRVLLPVMTLAGRGALLMWAELGGPATLIIGGLILLTAGLVIAWNRNWGHIQEKTHAVLDTIRDGIAAFTGPVQSAWQTFTDTLHTAWQSFADKVSKSWTDMWDDLKASVGVKSPETQAAVDALIDPVRTKWEKFCDDLEKRWSGTWDRIGKYVHDHAPGKGAFNAFNNAYQDNLKKEEQARANRASAQKEFGTTTPGMGDLQRMEGKEHVRLGPWAPPVLPNVLGQGGSGDTGTGSGKTDPALAALMDKEKQKHDAVQKQLQSAADHALRNQTERRFGENSKEVAAIDLYSKAYDRLTAAQEREAVQLATSRREAKASQDAMDAQRQKIDSVTKANEAAKKAAEAFHAKADDLRRRMQSGKGEFDDRKAIADKYGDADPAILNRTVGSEQDFNRAKERFDMLNKLRKEAETAEHNLRAARSQGQPNGGDAQAQALIDRAAAAKEGTDAIKKHDAAITELTKKNQELDAEYIKITHGSLKDQLALQSSLHVLYAQLPKDIQGIIDKEAQKVGRNEQESAAQKEALSLMDDLGTAGKKAFEDHQKLTGVSKDLTEAQINLNRAYENGDPLAINYAQAVEDARIADEKLAAAQKAAKIATEQQKQSFEALFQDLDRHVQVLRDLDLEYQKLTRGSLKDQVALNSEYKTTYDKLTPAMRQWVDAQVAGIEKINKKTQELDLLKRFASGIAGVFSDTFNNIFQHGFKGFFANIIHGFTNLFQQIALEIIRSQIERKLTDALTPKPKNQQQTSGGGGGLMGLLEAGLGIFAGVQGGGMAADTAAAGINDNGALLKSLPSFAAGGSYSGGPMWVGERGPELISPRTAGTVIPHAQSMAMAGGNHTTVHMTVVTQDAGSFQAPQNRHAITESLARELQRAQARRR